MRYIYNLIIFILLAILSINLSWQISSYLNFYYEQLYSPLKIEKHIQKYSKKNRNYYLRSFYSTSQAEHYRIFKDIIYSVNHDGKGLEKIDYFSTSHNKLLKFLTKPEIVHLKDVSRIVSIFNYLTIISFAIFVFILTIMLKKRIELYSFKEILLSMTSILTFLILFIIIIGPLKIFYYLHEIFFSNNQWFFYYEESLMTTLMKAPDIFAYISCSILFISIILYLILIKLTRLFYSYLLISKKISTD